LLLAFKANVAQSVRPNALFPHRGFVPWRLFGAVPPCTWLPSIIAGNPKPGTFAEYAVNKSQCIDTTIVQRWPNRPRLTHESQLRLIELIAGRPFSRPFRVMLAA